MQNIRICSAGIIFTLFFSVLACDKPTSEPDFSIAESPGHLTDDSQKSKYTRSVVSRALVRGADEMDLMVQLSWDNDADLDLWISNTNDELCQAVNPDAFCSWTNCVNGFDLNSDGAVDEKDPYLDIDNMTGYGPEQISIAQLTEGDLSIGVSFFGGIHRLEGTDLETNAQVRIFSRGVVLAERQIQLSQVKQSVAFYDLTFEDEDGLEVAEAERSEVCVEQPQSGGGEEYEPGYDPNNPVPQCTSDSDCAVGLICYEHFSMCMPGCRDDAGCPEGYMCESSQCRLTPECFSDSDCVENERCLSGQCSTIEAFASTLNPAYISVVHQPDVSIYHPDMNDLPAFTTDDIIGVFFDATQLEETDFLFRGWVLLSKPTASDVYVPSSSWRETGQQALQAGFDTYMPNMGVGFSPFYDKPGRYRFGVRLSERGSDFSFIHQVISLDIVQGATPPLFYGMEPDANACDVDADCEQPAGETVICFGRNPARPLSGQCQELCSAVNTCSNEADLCYQGRCVEREVVEDITVPPGEHDFSDFEDVIDIPEQGFAVTLEWFGGADLDLWFVKGEASSHCDLEQYDVSDEICNYRNCDNGVDWDGDGTTSSVGDPQLIMDNVGTDGPFVQKTEMIQATALNNGTYSVTVHAFRQVDDQVLPRVRLYVNGEVAIERNLAWGNENNLQTVMDFEVQDGVVVTGTNEPFITANWPCGN